MAERRYKKVGAHSGVFIRLKKPVGSEECSLEQVDVNNFPAKKNEPQKAQGEGTKLPGCPEQPRRVSKLRPPNTKNACASEIRQAKVLPPSASVPISVPIATLAECVAECVSDVGTMIKSTKESDYESIRPSGPTFSDAFKVSGDLKQVSVSEISSSSESSNRPAFWPPSEPTYEIISIPADYPNSPVIWRPKSGGLSEPSMAVGTVPSSNRGESKPCRNAKVPQNSSSLTSRIPVKIHPNPAKDTKNTISGRNLNRRN